MACLRRRTEKGGKKIRGGAGLHVYAYCLAFLRDSFFWVRYVYVTGWLALSANGGPDGHVCVLLETGFCVRLLL